MESVDLYLESHFSGYPAIFTPLLPASQIVVVHDNVNIDLIALNCTPF
jgi:hypothetical protein